MSAEKGKSEIIEEDDSGACSKSEYSLEQSEGDDLAYMLGHSQD